MRKTKFSNLLLAFLCIVLVAAIALGTVGCDQQNSKPTAETPKSGEAEKTVRGEGKTVFDFKVTDVEGKVTAFEIHTDEKTVGAALLALDLIAGDNSSYGLYVKTVNGITVDYDKDGKYWAFYVNGEYASKGVDATDAEAGACYEFKAE